MRRIIAVILGLTIAGCATTQAIPRSPIAQLSPTERQLLTAETSKFSRVVDTEATIERWCAMAGEEQLLPQVVEYLKAGNIQELSVAAIGFRRVCPNRRIYFDNAIKTAKTPENAEIVRTIGDLTYGL